MYACMAKTLSREDVIKLMRKRQGGRTDADFARELGISAPYLFEIYKGTRDPGDKVLDALGLQRETVYRKENASEAVG